MEKAKERTHNQPERKGGKDKSGKDKRRLYDYRQAQKEQAEILRNGGRKDTGRNRARTLDPIIPSAAIESQYRKKLNKLIDDMTHASFWWIKSAYKSGDVDKINETLEKQKDKWNEEFGAVALIIATWLALKIYNRTTRLVCAGIEKAGLAPISPTPPTPFKKLADIKIDADKNMLKSVIAENVSLIKSIPEQYLKNVETIIQQGIQNGHDIKYIATELYKRYGITERRAKMIASDQTNKVSQTLTRLTYLNHGITEAYWVHTAIGKTYRRTHVQMNGMRYNLAEGLYDPDPKIQRKIHTGELINCHCVFRAIIPNKW